MMCGKCIAMTLNAHHDPLCVAFIIGNLKARGLPYAALNVLERRFVENTPW
jgi:hypothetical protein